MLSKANNNWKHLTLEERNFIEQSLNQNMSFKALAEVISKDPTTVSKEVKKHRFRSEIAHQGIKKNRCKDKEKCHKKNLCGLMCGKECKTCIVCNSNCPEFKENLCNKINLPPYVCNGCKTRRSCKQTQYIYRALPAYQEYKSAVVYNRIGISLSRDELAELDALISPLIKQGQSISHIYATNCSKIPCSRKTLYTYIDKNYFSVGNLDLPRKVRLKKRKQKKSPPRDTRNRQGRTYEDFLNYTLANPDLPVVELDIVEGKKGGNVLLTMLFRSTKLMLAFILEDKKAESVIAVFDYLETLLGRKIFQKTFPIILTDNGSEFAKVDELEAEKNKTVRTKIFYCDPQASYQKGRLEKNHEFIRYVIPRGKSMDEYTQEDINLMINHINSLTRESLNGRSPFEISRLLIDKKVLKKLNLIKVKAKEIKLTSKLLKKN